MARYPRAIDAAVCPDGAPAELQTRQASALPEERIAGGSGGHSQSYPCGDSEVSVGGGTKQIGSNTNGSYILLETAHD